MDNQVIKDRKFTAGLIKKVLLREIPTYSACKKFPKSDDNSIQCAFFALVHLEADEDIRKKDANYKNEQDDYLLYIMQILEKGEELPQNIINEYKKYYEKALIYPKQNVKNIIKMLKQFINI